MSIGHFPQVFKIMKRKSAKDVSLITYSIFAIGGYVWSVYGILIKEIPIITSYILGSIGATWVVILIIKYRSN